MTIMGMEIAKQSEDVSGLLVVKNEETYEPKQISVEVKLALEEERKILKEKQAEDEKYDIFNMVDEKQMGVFKDLFGTEEVEEEIMNKFNKFQYSAFEMQKCDKHRNAI